jgi:uncharacterized protein YyaL (SSP411 family)
VYDVTPAGNFEGLNILNLPKTIEQCAKLKDRDVDELAAELAGARQKLFERRSGRIRPARDDKVLVAWNALAIEALARAAAALDEPRYAAAGATAADFLLTRVRREDGRLWHSYAAGGAKFDAYLDDYACLISALVALYETDFNERWINDAVRLAELMTEHFRDPDEAGFYYTADDHEQLIARVKDCVDSSVPSGNSAAACALLRLGHLTARDDFLTTARATIAAFAGIAMQSPTACGQLLLAADHLLGPSPQIVILGDPASDRDVARAVTDLRRRFLPTKVVACRNEPASDADSALDPLFAGKQPSSAAPTVFVCHDFTCDAPRAGAEAAIAAWDELTEALRAT